MNKTDKELELIAIECREIEEQTKRTLDKATEQDTIEQLLKKFNIARADFNNYSPSEQSHARQEAFRNYTIFDTTCTYLRNKLKNKVYNEVEQDIKKALAILEDADNKTSILLNNNIFYYVSDEHKATQNISNKLFNIIRLLKELIEE